MPTKFEKLLPLLQENAWPDMRACLAEQLGVGADTLFKLGVGYLPAVQFKRGLNTRGWWVIPERDHEANVVGLGLRGWDGTKVMYPGSKHGLIFQVNPDHQKGGTRYHAGKENWVRTMDAGVECPVCGKPDGCLLSAENPEDPQAVICIRERSPRVQEMGWLHIRKAAGHLRPGGRALVNADPVVVVEGMTDTAAAMDLGFVAVGRPSNLAGLGELAKLVRNRDLIIIGENDRKWDATTGEWKHPGLDGMLAAFDYLRPHCRKVTRVLPPEDFKDLRAWKTAGLTSDEFLAYVEGGGETRAELKHLGTAEPLAVAETWLKQTQSIGEKLILRRLHGDWFRWDMGRYNSIEADAMIRGGLYHFLADKTYSTTGTNGEETVKAYNPTRSKVTDIVDALNRDCPVVAEPPCWLDDRDTPDPKWVIAYPNGILDVARYLDGDEDNALLDPTPDLFTLSTLPYPFDPTALCPEWEKFLATTFEDDPQKIKLLQEWFGYCMLPDNSAEKIMLFRGPSRAGKGVTLSMLESLVGRDQFAATSFDSIASANGVAQLIGKLVAAMPDAVLSHKIDKPKALGVLLSIAGNDPITVKKLYQDEYTSTLYARFTIAVNELPSLPDHAGALENRLIILEFGQSFKGREDRTLKNRLPDEAPGVAVWALEGLRRLRDRGTFTIPKSSHIVLDEFRKVSSPIAEFMEECCELDDGQKAEIEKAKLWDAWVAWSRERGMNPGFTSRFLTRFRAKSPTIGSATYTHAGKKRSVLTGVRLQPWAEQRLLGRPD